MPQSLDFNSLGLDDSILPSSKRKNIISKITDSLLLCGVFEMDDDVMKELGVTTIINCTADYPSTKRPFVTNYTTILVEDRPETNLFDCFDLAAKEIDKAKKNGGKTLVHCERGVSRSSTLCIAYLMKCLKMSLFDAFNLVKEKRPLINPNIGFFKQLIEYEKQLFGKTTVALESIEQDKTYKKPTELDESEQERKVREFEERMMKKKSGVDDDDLDLEKLLSGDAQEDAKGNKLEALGEKSESSAEDTTKESDIAKSATDKDKSESKKQTDGDLSKNRNSKGAESEPGYIKPISSQALKEDNERKPDAKMPYGLTPITDYLYLGGVHEMEEDVMKNMGMTSIVNCTVNYRNPNFPFITHYTQIHVDDLPDSDLFSCFDLVAEEIKKAKHRGGKCLVHCERGISRSATVCIAYLMKFNNMTLFEAHQLVKTKRPLANPNIGFFKQLMRYEKMLYGKNSVRLD